MLELRSLGAFENWLYAETKPPAAIQALDLRRYKGVLKKQKFYGSLFLSCKLCRSSAHAIVKGGGVIIPDSPNLSFPAHRDQLYSVEEIFAGFNGGMIADYQLSLIHI